MVRQRQACLAAVRRSLLQALLRRGLRRQAGRASGSKRARLRGHRRSEGLVVTNHHVIQGADEITVVLADRREFDGRAGAPTSAPISRFCASTRRRELPTLELRDSDEAEVGDLVLAIGNPFGVGQTVTSGIVSALGPHPGRHHRLQLLHPDRRGDQSGQLGRRPGDPGRPADRHQHGDLLAQRRLDRHRLRGALQHGAHRGRQREAGGRWCGPGSGSWARRSAPTWPRAFGLARPGGVVVSRVLRRRSGGPGGHPPGRRHRRASTASRSSTCGVSAASASPRWRSWAAGQAPGLRRRAGRAIPACMITEAPETPPRTSRPCATPPAWPAPPWPTCRRPWPRSSTCRARGRGSSCGAARHHRPAHRFGPGDILTRGQRREGRSSAAEKWRIS